MIELTEKATAKVREFYASEPTLGGKSLRLFVEAGGCSGFQYGLTFDEKRSDDQTFRVGEIEIVVDPQSSMYITGARIDYIESIQESGFSISNAKAKSSCGCGQSFEF